MEWKINGTGGDISIAIVGDLDLYSAPAFARMALEGIDRGWNRIALDFSETEYLDSTGIGVIIRMLQGLKRAGGSMRCRGLHGAPRKVLAMSNILALLPEEKGGAA